MQIGAQLYTCWQRTQTLEDLDNALRRVSEIGYRSVQVSGTCEYEPEWLCEKLEKYNLVCAMTHVNPTKLIENPEKVVSDHAVFGCKHIGIGGMPRTLRGSVEGYEEFKKIYLPIAEKVRDLGAKFLYHNHSFEFEKIEGKDVIERIFEDFPANSVDFTLDVGWAAFAGADVPVLIKKLEGRLSRIHLKDYADKPEDGSITTSAYLRPIYEGKVDYDSYIKLLADAGCKYMLVEQDYCYDEDEFDCLRRSFENVIKRFPEVR